MDPLAILHQAAPQFRLPALDGQIYDLEQGRGKILLLNFWSAECPWAERADRAVQSYLPNWGEKVKLWTIASNQNESLELIQQVAAERGLAPVLRDQHAQVADLYGAQTTPHFYLVDQDGVLRYQGALNDVTFRQRTPTREYLREAVEALLKGNKPDPDQIPAYGCTIVRSKAAS